MSKEYDEYLKAHRENVIKAFEWMKDHDFIPNSALRASRIRIHDDSKEDKEEYEAYDDYFYGDDYDSEDQVAVDKAFDYAWLHHIHHNPHHWQYWTLINDDGTVKPLEMPEEYVYEMIADWWSFSWKTGKLNEIFDWYEKHKGRIRLADKTRKLVEDILEKIRKEIGDGDRS